MDMMQELDAAEGAMKNVRVKLQKMGREIYQMRNGKELGAQYGFERYERANFAGSNYVDQEGPDWGVGTPILSLIFFWSHGGGGETATVTLPMRYLTIPNWREEEQVRIDQERAEAAERRNVLNETWAREKEARERRDYERLHKKFGGELSV